MRSAVREGEHGVVEDAARPVERVGLGPVVTAMEQLRSAIDVFLERATGTGGAHPVTPASSVPAPSEAPPAPAARAWEQAASARGDGDPQRGWIEANAAMRRGEHPRAFELFEAEADRAAEAGDHARAAIAYRMASDAASALGRSDAADYDLRRAGKHYLFVAESPASSLQTMYRSYLTASRCFLSVGNLELTQSCVSRALTLQETMNEDLHTRFNGPVRDRS